MAEVRRRKDLWKAMEKLMMIEFFRYSNESEQNVRNSDVSAVTAPNLTNDVLSSETTPQSGGLNFDEEGKKEVVIELVALNQRHEVVAHGEAVVQLPD